jgi:hypothetical protein
VQFIDNAPFYKLVRITGPKHNLLVLKLSPTMSSDEIVVERLDVANHCADPISADEVRSQVVRAAEEFLMASGPSISIELIQYLAGDSRPVDVYYEMAKEILKRAEAARP